MPKVVNFTIANIEKFQTPTGNNRNYYHDTKVNGLCISVTKAGVMSFLVNKRLKGRARKITLGRVSDLKVEQARAMAKKTISDLAHGIDPIAAKKAQRTRGVILQDVFDDYMQNRNDKLSANTKSNYKTVMKKHLYDWLDTPMLEISRDMVERKHTNISEYSKTAANKTMRVLRALFNYANGKYEDEEGRGLFPDNPVSRLTHVRAWNRETRRNNRIRNTELHTWFESAIELRSSDDPFTRTAADYFQFTLLNGLRRREAAGLLRADVDFKERCFTIRNTKNRLDLTLPLSDYSLGILHRCCLANDSIYAFPSNDLAKPINDPRRALARLQKSSGIHFTIHDLRRTFITIAESLDISVYALKRLVNHGTGGDVTAGYVVWDVERLRKPMQQITDYILKTAEIKSSRTPTELQRVP